MYVVHREFHYVSCMSLVVHSNASLIHSTEFLTSKLILRSQRTAGLNFQEQIQAKWGQEHNQQHCQVRSILPLDNHNTMQSSANKNISFSSHSHTITAIFARIGPLSRPRGRQHQYQLSSAPQSAAHILSHLGAHRTALGSQTTSNGFGRSLRYIQPPATETQNYFEHLQPYGIIYMESTLSVGVPQQLKTVALSVLVVSRHPGRPLLADGPHSESRMSL